MQRVERILMKPSDPNYRAALHMCRKVKTVHNCANYLMRESFFASALIKWDLADFHIRMGAHQHEAYQEIPNAMSQQTVRRLGDAWDNYFKALKAYQKNPDSFTGKPKIPGYAKGSKTAIMPFQAMKCVNNEIIFPKKSGLFPVKITCCTNQPMMAKGEEKVIMEVRFVPQGNCIWLEVAYKVSEEKRKKRTLSFWTRKST